MEAGDVFVVGGFSYLCMVPRFAVLYSMVAGITLRFYLGRRNVPGEGSLGWSGGDKRICLLRCVFAVPEGDARADAA